MEIARDEVRVMTVHGAKGLEAPIVILADTMTQPSGPRPPRLLELADGAVIWAGRKDDDVAPVAAARQAALAEAEDEYRRLLYVAMTRAADRLIICGADGERARPKGCWYDLVVEPLRPFLVEEQERGEKVWRYRKQAADVTEKLRIAGRADRASRTMRNPRVAAAAGCLRTRRLQCRFRRPPRSRRKSVARLRARPCPPPTAARRWPAGVSSIG